MNRKLILAATCALLFLGACTVSSTGPQPDMHVAHGEQSDTTKSDGGGSMGSGN